MFFKKEITYKIIEPNTTHKDIQKILDKELIYPEMDKNIVDEWYGFCYYYYLQNTKTKDWLLALSFSLVTTYYMTGQPILTGINEENIQEENIKEEIFKQYKKIYKLPLTEEEKARNLFKYIFNFYTTKAVNYEKTIDTINVKINTTQQQMFNNVKGNTKAEKFRELLYYYNSMH